ncbi:MAG TPA: CHAT domain-containing protein [Polyangia bacterium]|nr:CHAT domain-containing protein [Polyangia bacterium]
MRDHLAEYRRLALASGDPWFILIADTEEAKAETAQGEHRMAEERLLAALDMGQRQKMEYRCVWIESALVSLYRAMDRLSAAEAHAQAGWELAKKTGDWQAETTFLSHLSGIALARNNISRSQALLDELDWHDPEGCERRRYAHVVRADGYMRELRYAEAREEIRKAPLCHQPLTLRAAGILAHLDRAGMSAEPWEQLRAEIADLRLHGGLGPGAMAVAVHIEGVLLLEHDRRQGEALLQRAQVMSEFLRAKDQDARLAYTYSSKELVLAAGQSGEFDRAQVLLAGAHGLYAAQGCTLGAIVEGERLLVVAVDAEGRVHGHYEGHRTNPRIDGLGAGQDALRSSLAGCTEIDVFPETPVQDLAGVLPIEKAWVFHKVRSVSRPWGKSQARRLVVRSPLLGPQGDEAPLPPWSRPRKEGETVTYLEGRDATPERVLAEMPKYTEVVLHVPCVFQAGEQQLLLSPDRHGKHTLAASEVLRVRLPDVRLVTLTACTSHPTAGSFDDPQDLPSAFLSAGVGAVLAAYDATLDAGAAEFFEDVAARLRAGQTPATALRDVRVVWVEKKKKEWVKKVVVYD